MKGTYLVMSQKEIDRASILESVGAGQISLVESAKKMDLSYRQCKRIMSRFKESGAQGLIHRNRGKESSKKISAEKVEEIFKIINENYADFGATLTCEKLKENHKINLSKETIRKIMIKYGLWKPKKKKHIRVFRQRERRHCFGELVQMDGSYHAWFEKRAEKCCLIVLVDDATGSLLGLYLCDRETTHNYFKVIKRYLNLYGKPSCIYTDKHSVFKVNTTSNETSSSEESPRNTQFSRALEELGIQLITANTPQAKGRVERANKTLQDRLVKELRLRKISSIEAANEYLPLFIESYNEKFSVLPIKQENYHQTLLKSEDLETILCKKFHRRLSQELSFQYSNTLFQIITKRPAYVLRKKEVNILDRPDQPLKVLYKGEELAYKIFPRNQKQGHVLSRKNLNNFLDLNKKKKTTTKPEHGPLHPWRIYKKALDSSSKLDLVLT